MSDARSDTIINKFFAHKRAFLTEQLAQLSVVKIAYWRSSS